MARTHALYRFFALDGALLYIGITLDPSARWRQHRSDKPWWHEVATVTIERYPDRLAVLAAEAQAIRTEHPRYNVTHNQGRPASAARISSTGTGTYDSSVNLWTYELLRSGRKRTADLYLGWEVNGTPLTDNYLRDEITADELMRIWMRRYGLTDPTIYWFVSPIHETAPFQVRDWAADDFLSHYSWPVNEYTGERLSWNRLPVLDDNWTDSGDKGGFFQEVTGWKPAPLQSHVPLRQVLAAAGLT